nr:hypothetical protein HUO10_004242 [Paraburkholderia busanensis]
MPIIPELNAIACTRPLRSAYHGNTNAPINWPTEPEPIRKPISHGVRYHFAIRIGSVAAIAITSKPSKNVARPINMRARTCIAFFGNRSSRAMIEPRVTGPETPALLRSPMVLSMVLMPWCRP